MKELFHKTDSGKRADPVSLLMLAGSLVFYLFFAFYDKAVICVDSPSYLSMNISREPLYPVFLAALRGLFGGLPGDGYLTVAAFLQSILAALAAFSLADYIRKECALPAGVAAVLWFIPLAVSLLCRFGAKRGSMYSNSILTEGITIAGYMLFFRYLLEYYFHKSAKSLIACCILTFLMISARKQMVIALAMLMVCIPAAERGKKQVVKGIGTAVLAAVLILAGSTGFDLAYNYALRGEGVRHSSDARFLTTMAFYTAEREDAAYLESEEIRELFLKIYDACEENGYLGHSAGEGWLNRVSHFGDHYDHIQIDTMWPAVNDFVREHYGDGEVELSENADRIMGEINRALLPRNAGRLLGAFLDNFRSGLVTTVARRNRILNWYSLFVYLLYLALLALNIREGKNSRQAACAARIAGLVLLSIVFNVGLVSLVIFCQTRYTIYNMALFYMSLILMLYSLAGIACKKGINGLNW